MTPNSKSNCTKKMLSEQISQLLKRSNAQCLNHPYKNPCSNDVPIYLNMFGSIMKDMIFNYMEKTFYCHKI